MRDGVFLITPRHSCKRGWQQTGCHPRYCLSKIDRYARIFSADRQDDFLLARAGLEHLISQDGDHYSVGIIREEWSAQ